MAHPRRVSTAPINPASRVGGFPASNVMDVRSMGGINATCILPSAAGIIAPGTIASAFLDGFGQAATGNIPLTNADANFFDGRVTNGEIVTIFGVQIMAFEVLQAAPFTVNPLLNPLILSDILQSVSLRLQLKGQSYPIGNCQLFPSGLGTASAPKNGGNVTQAWRFPASAPLILEENDQFFIELRAERGITLSAVGQAAMFKIYCPATTSVSLANLSGA